IGESIVPLAAYYLLSPYNVLAFFFPYEQLAIAILWIITLKLALMRTTMFSYLKYTYQKVDGTTLLFSTSYSFCGFVTVYSQNFMW
ncbi:YfhO family protein, partial [Enterococcus faecalis]|uniref:YfhO family protein n=1 Tax=Enterococcus faecalis TaxID=1351 RepID=UPI003D6A9216